MLEGRKLYAKHCLKILDVVSRMRYVSEVGYDSGQTPLLNEQVCGEKRLSIRDGATVSSVQGLPILGGDHLRQGGMLTLVLDLGNLYVFSVAKGVEAKSF